MLHSPSRTSAKWWPGGLGRTATHCILMARLLHGGRDLGPHAFVLPLRDPETHCPFAGITIGDIGPKQGYNGVDNGFMMLDHVTLPRDHMLMKNASMSADGVYSPPRVAKASYGTMISVRAGIVATAGLSLAKAATIAVRYCAVRRQTAAEGESLETQVLDYANCSAALLPLVASAFALHATGRHMRRMYANHEASADSGNFGGLAELHATSSGLKAVCTWMTGDGIEAARRCCGGHGYSALSGLPDLVGDYNAQVAYEGDNNVLSLQTARFLLGQLRALGQARPQGDAAYLARCSTLDTDTCTAANEADISQPQVLLAALEHASCRAVTVAAAAFDAAVAAGSTVDGARNTLAVPLIAASKAHCEAVIMRCLCAFADDAPPELATIFSRLTTLFGLERMHATLGPLLADGHLQPRHAAIIDSARTALLRELRPDAVALVDAFELPDAFLNSAIGRKDGDVYEALFRAAQQSPLNRMPTPPGYDIIRPLLAAKL